QNLLLRGGEAQPPRVDRGWQDAEKPFQHPASAPGMGHCVPRMPLPARTRTRRAGARALVPALTGRRLVSPRDAGRDAGRESALRARRAGVHRISLREGGWKLVHGLPERAHGEVISMKWSREY